MKLKEILEKQGLTEEQITAIQQSMSDNKIYETTVENAENRVATLENEKTTLTKELETANNRITTLENAPNGDKKLQDTIAERDKTIQTLEASIKQRDLFDELKGQGCKNPKAVAALLDNSKLEYKEGKHNGLDEQIKALKESDSYLFNEESKPEPGGTGGSGDFRGSGNKGKGETESIGTRLGKLAQAQNNDVFENNPYFN